MGAFDDLIPTADSAKGAFADLIPAPETARGSFSDLISDVPPANEDFDSHVNWTRAKFPHITKPEAIRMVAEKFKRDIPTDPTAFEAFKDTVAGLPGEAAKGFGRSVVIAPLRFVSRVGDRFTQDTTQHTPGPLERLANAGESSMETAFPTPADSGLEQAVAQGAGQLGSLFMGGAALKALGAGPKLIGGGIAVQGGVNEFDDAFGRAIERGDDSDTAFAKSLGYATIAGLIENRLGAGRLWRQMFPSAELAAKKLTALGVSRAVAANVLAGGVEEGSQRFAQNLIVDQKPSLEGVMEEAIPGAILEGAMGMPVAVGNQLQQHAAYQDEQQDQRAIEQSGQRAALEASMPIANGKLTVNRAADQSFVKGAFDDLIPKQTLSQSQSPVAPENSEAGKNQTPAAVQATSPNAGASNSPISDAAAQVRTELRALPGANEDLQRTMPALTSEQTDAGLREQPATDDNVPATKADLKALADFIQNGGQNPFAATPKATEPQSAQSQPVKNTSPETVQTGVNGATGDLTGSSTSPRAVIGNPTTENVKPDPDFIAPEKPAATKIEIKNGDTVSVVTRKGAKPRAARVLQLQPDGSAQVVVAGEQTARWLTKDQITPSRRAVTQQAKADELAGFAPEQQTQIKQRAAEFRQLVEDYAPQLEWTPAEAYDESFGTDTKDVGFRKAELRTNAIRQAMRAVFPNGQENSQVDQANALPALERYLKEKFPGDNSVAKRRTLEQFSRSETSPEQTATVERDQATLDQLAASRPDKSEFQGLRAVGRSVSTGKLPVRQRGTGAGVLSSAGASTLSELERIFGVRIIFVENARFNGVRINGTNLVLINSKSPRATMAIAGHELLHHIKATHPGLYADFVAQARALLKNSEQFRSELAAKGYTNISDGLVEEEMFADVLGDAVLDPTFLQELAKAEPNLFKRFARTAVKWLEKLIAKAKAMTGFDSAQYVTDLTEMRERLLNLLRDAGRQTQFDRAGIEADAGQSAEQGQDAFSVEDGNLFDAPESVEEQRARLSREKAQKSQADAKKTMEERAGARLIGKDLDTTQEMFGAEVKRDKSGQGDMFSLEAGPRWRSNIQGALASWQNKGTPEQLRAHLAKTRGAMDEAEWIGLDEFLNGKASVTKQDVADFVKANTVDVQEVEQSDKPPMTERERLAERDRIAQEKYGKPFDELESGQRFYVENDMNAETRNNTKFSNYQLPGGENYRELLLTLNNSQTDVAAAAKRVDDLRSNGSDEEYENAKAEWIRTMERSAKASEFKSAHFDKANILAHVRFNERTDAGGKKVLFIEEVQSDWHQKGRKEGYAGESLAAAAESDIELKRIDRTPDQNPKIYPGYWESYDKRDGRMIMRHGGDMNQQEAMKEAVQYAHYHAQQEATKSVPNAPFKQTWPMLAMKRMIRYASENGFDRIAWTTGEQQAERYDLSKQISSLRVFHAKDGSYDLSADVHGRGMVDMASRIQANQIEDYVGKEMAAKIISGEQKPSKVSAPVEGGDGVWKTYSGLDLKVGGEGMKGFYDKILPSEVNKFVKKWGGRVGKTEIQAERPHPPDDLGEGLDPYEAQAVRDEWRMENEANSTAQNGKHVAHSLDITPAMRDAALEGFDMFSLPKPEDQSEFTKLQDDITAAEAELMTAIRQHMNPPAGMRKAEALEAKNDAHRKLRDLLRQQLKMMTDIRNLDAARSPEETANLISQTVDLLNSIQDDISERNAKSEAVPADLTKLRTDLQERLMMLKGWTDAQEDETRAGKVEKQPRRDDRFTELESASDPERNGWPQFLAKLQFALKKITSPIPELPLTGPRATTSALFRRGYRLFAVENNRVRKEAAERVNQVVEPLTKLGRKPADNEAQSRYYKLHNALRRAEMNPEQRAAILKQMRALEESTLNKDPYHLFRKLVLYKDLRWRATYLKNDAGKPITLPMGLTVDEVASELRRTYQQIEEHPNGLAITESLRRHYKLTDDLQKSIIEHGEIIPESLRNPLYFPHFLADQWTGRVDRVRPKTEEDFRRYLIAPKGSPKLIQVDYLKAMMLHTADVLAHNARVDLVAKYWQPYDISERLKAQHGDKWTMPWNIPPGYKLYSPYKKLSLRMDYILSREVLADKLGVLFNDGDLRARMGETGKVVKVTPEDLHAALVAGEKIQWALPEEIADALDGIDAREKAAANPGLGHSLALPVRYLHRRWKQVKLFAPWSWIRYEYGNLTTDMVDKVLIADPGTAKQMARARKEIWNADKGEQSPEFKAALREGILETITEGEMANLSRLPEFEAFQTPAERRASKVRALGESSMRGSRFREQVFRYAKFLADVERLRKGEQPVFGGAYHGDITALGQDVDGQRRMLDGEELIYAQAAEISLKTYGDYESISVFSQFLRTYIAPFWSWQDVNFRYHANLLRNVADGLAARTMPKSEAARTIGGATASALGKAAFRVGVALFLYSAAQEWWNRYGGVLLGLWDEDDDLENKLSEADRRRSHIILGKDKNGKVLVVYMPGAFADVMEWVGGTNLKRLFMEYATSKITLDVMIRDYAKALPSDFINKSAQGTSPAIKAIYEGMSGKATFPDVLDQRNIPESDKYWRLVGGLTDDRAVNVLRAAFDKDYYIPPASEQLQQIILQVRRRDPEQWAYFEVREDASAWKLRTKGEERDGGDYKSPAAQAVRNFRKAIYRGDVANAERFYSRLIELGYTAERLDASIRSQHPLNDLKVEERTEYLKTLTPKQKQELELATQYYNRIKALDGREKQLFPKKGQQPKPNPELLKRIVEEQRN